MTPLRVASIGTGRWIGERGLGIVESAQTGRAADVAGR